MYLCIAILPCVRIIDDDDNLQVQLCNLIKSCDSTTHVKETFKYLFLKLKNEFFSVNRFIRLENYYCYNNSSKQNKINLPKMTFQPLSEAFIRRSWYSVLPVLDTTGERALTLDMASFRRVKNRKN